MASEEGGDQMQGERVKGHVKWFNDQKGFGFITPVDGGEDLFVHHSGIKTGGYRSLGEGEAVEFEVEVGGDGRAKAVNVSGPDGAPVQGGGRSGGGGGGYGGYNSGGYGGGGSRSGGRGGGGGYGGGGYGGGGGGYGGGGGGYGGGGGGSGCFKCGEQGHLARDCYQGGGGGGGGRYGGGSGGGGGGSGCYKCGEDGHFARECPSSNR